MPLYDYKCQKCQRVAEFFAHSEDRTQRCGCGGVMDRQLGAPNFKAPMQPYKSPITGQWIEGERMRREDLSRHNCVEYDPGMKQDQDRRQKDAEVSLDKAVDRAVHEAVQQIN